MVYNPTKVAEGELPSSVFELTDPKWKGRIAIAPTNGSFQAFVTAMRLKWGDQRTAEWLRGLKDNSPKIYEDNALIVDAVNGGQVDLGLVNHYYLYQLEAEIGKDALVARNHYTAAGDPGSLVNVAGIGLLKGANQPAEAARLVEFLLGDEAQRHFAGKNYEYPLIPGVSAVEGLVPLQQIQSPDVNLSDLSNLDGTLTLMREVGLL
jgi:iron(III) transport system substrate-binding protein